MRDEFYTLTVALWPHAIAAGVEPVEMAGFQRGPQYYWPHEFYFEHAPTREDWWELCRVTPWMGSYEKDPDQSLIESNPWPLVLPGKKAADVNILDALGRKAGRLDVRRHHIVNNPCRSFPFITVDLKERMIRGLRGERHERANYWVMLNHIRIAEEAMRRTEGDPSDALIVQVGKELLKQFVPEAAAVA